MTRKAPFLCTAYTYNAPAPLLTKVRPNVIIRLCVGGKSAPADFMRPLASAANAPFRAQLHDWRVKANATRLFVWNYVCDFVSVDTRACQISD